jgi:histidinol-phosphate/aromatic aminotransferase/cobyric acid decarboxylase-like protein
MERGVIVRGMTPFGLGEESFRVTIGTSHENSKFIKELKEIIS